MKNNAKFKTYCCDAHVFEKAYKGSVTYYCEKCKKKVSGQIVMQFLSNLLKKNDTNNG